MLVVFRSCANGSCQICCSLFVQVPRSMILDAQGFIQVVTSAGFSCPASEEASNIIMLEWKTTGI